MRLVSILPTALAVCPLLTGPRTSVVYAECWDRVSQKGADAARARAANFSLAGQTPAKSQKKSTPRPPGGAFVGACVSKPTDTGSDAPGLTPTSAGREDFRPQPHGSTPLLSQIASLLELRPAIFRAQAPPSAA